VSPAVVCQFSVQTPYDSASAMSSMPIECNRSEIRCGIQHWSFKENVGLDNVSEDLMKGLLVPWMVGIRPVTSEIKLRLEMGRYSSMTLQSIFVFSCSDESFFRMIIL